MEKIYMEENQKKSSKQRRNVSSSVVLSFVVAIFAIFSLVVCGISQVSYAIDPQGVQSFTFRVGQGSVSSSAVGDLYVHGVSGGKVLDITLLYSDDAFQNSIFCVERNQPIEDGIEYNMDSLIESSTYGFGLLYILNNSYANSSSNFLSSAPKEVRIWATQAAIWLYLDQVYKGSADYSKHQLSDDEKEVINNLQSLSLYNGDDEFRTLTYTDNVSSAIKTLVAAAVEYNTSHPADLKISNQPSSFTKSTEGDFYQSEIVTVEATGNLKDYTVSLSGIEGAYIVDQNGNEISNTLRAGASFYIRIPADKVKTEVQTLKVHVDANFNMLTGYYYTATGLQKVVSVTDKVLNVPAEFSLDIVGAPDTGMTAAQTIYFIGLIVLLCGVGIVYANAKPVESK